MNIINTFAAATFALATVALPLTAANASEPRAATISYADLNLSSEEGQAILDRRIANAVEQVCGKLENRPTFDAPIRKCQQETILTARQSRDLAVADYTGGRLALRGQREIRLVAR
jgi:UrcA family protein